ncbi:MAG: TRAP transporter substrate-binding protein DctP [Dehalococcoidia bacterium]|nr:TRAP transporter substrate-binding protein DctP [Dehalococcoidia bacterium]
MKRKILLSMLALLLAISLVAIGCAKPAPAPAPAPAPTPEPIPAGPEYTWRWQCLYHPGLSFDYWGKGIADMIEEMSGGRIEIEVFHGGALCPNKEIYTALGQGQFEMATNVGAFCAGIIPVGYIEFTPPGGPRTGEELDLLFYNYGWLELLQQVYNTGNIHYIAQNPCGWRNLVSTKPIRSVDDLKGMKVRCTGLDALLLERLGAVPTYIPTGDIYTGLALGTVDASLYGGPATHWDQKLMEVVKYEILPNIETASSNTLINLDVWDSLPEDLKLIIQVAARYQGSEGYRAREIECRDRIERMKKEYGIEFIVLPESEVAKIRAAGIEVLREKAAVDPTTAKMLEIMEDAMEYFEWRYAGIIR